MPIRQVCNKEVITIESGETVLEAAKLMKKKHVGSLIVTEEKNGNLKPVGIISDRDIVRLVVAGDRSAARTRVEAIMVRNLKTVRESEGIFEAIRQLGQNGIRRIPVVNDDGDLTGILASDDIFSMLASELWLLSRISGKQIRREIDSTLLEEEPYLV